MKKLVALILYVFAFQQLGVSQQLYRDGFILKSPFDTIHGQVKYYSYNQAAQKCLFRNTATGVEQVFLPNDIFGYGIEDNILFKSHKISEDQHLFLEVVYQGTVNLYAYRDRFRKNFFFLENNQTGDFEALTQKVIGSRRRRNTIKTYQGVLKIMLDKSDLILDEIERSTLSHKSLTNLLLAYDERYARYKGRVFNGSRELWPPKLGFYGMIGRAQQKLGNYAGTGSSFYNGIGVKFQKEISRATRRLFIDVDFTIAQEVFVQTYQKTEDVTDQSILTNGLNFLLSSTNTTIRGEVENITLIDIERINIGMPVNLKYVFPGNKWLLSINGGLSPQHAISKNGQVQGLLRQGETTFLDIVSQEDTDRFRVAMNMGFGLMLKGRNTFFLDFQHSPTWFNQGILKYKYSFLRLGMLLDKKK